MYPCIIVGVNEQNPGTYLQGKRLREEMVSVRWDMRGDVELVNSFDVTVAFQWIANARELHPWEHCA